MLWASDTKIIAFPHVGKNASYYFEVGSCTYLPAIL